MFEVHQKLIKEQGQSTNRRVTEYANVKLYCFKRSTHVDILKWQLLHDFLSP